VLLWVLTFILYLVVGMILTLHYNIVDADGPSRVANAGYVLFSRNPHLAAIGFVWNPLPSLVELPILLFYKVWPLLLTRGQAGTIMAAFFMASAVWQVRGIAIDRRVPSTWRWLIVGCFALDPMIILYGGNGMSEAPFVFCMLWMVRRLLRWIRDDKAHDLAVAGIALGFGYLTRYEAVAAAAATTVLVVGVTALRRQAPNWMARIRLGFLDGAVVVFPFTVVFIGWAVAGYIITGTAFAQFSSQYGNSSQVGNASVGVKSFQQSAGGPIEIVIRDMLYLEPLLPLVIIVLVIYAVRRVELDCLVPLTVFGSILAFEAAAQITGQTFAWFRFFIMVIPLMMVSLVLIWPYRGQEDQASTVSVEAPPPIEAWWGRPVEAVESAFEVGLGKLKASKLAARASKLSDRAPKPWRHFDITSRSGRALGALMVALVLLPSLPSAMAGILNPIVGTQSEEQNIHEVVDPSHYPIKSSSLANNWYVASYIDRLNLPNGSVLMDTFIGWDVWLASSRRHQFVITSDYDFVAALNAPVQHGIQYILVSDPRQDGKADAINHRYPTLYRTGAGIATLVMSVPSTGDDESWRLYKLIRP